MGKKKKLSAMNLEHYSFKNAQHKDVTIRCRILIVCEGEKTEPNYFMAFDQMQYGRVVYDVECEGGKINTIKVVDKAIEMKERALKCDNPYDAVWAVFDKDDFPASAFNAAIIKAEQHNIGCAWSNEAFELWYVYHFANRATAMTRDEFKNVISKCVNDSPKYKLSNKYVYKKNDPNTRQSMITYGDEAKAIKLAEKQAANFNDNRYATHNPCTMVYKLVRLLRGEDERFNQMIIDDVNK